jgi:hypothetical protein
MEEKEREDREDDGVRRGGKLGFDAWLGWGIKEARHVTSQKFQNRTNEFPYFQILELTKTFIQLSFIHSDLA